MFRVCTTTIVISELGGNWFVAKGTIIFQFLFLSILLRIFIIKFNICFLFSFVDNSGTERI